MLPRLFSSSHLSLGPRHTPDGSSSEPEVPQTPASSASQGLVCLAVLHLQLKN